MHHGAGLDGFGGASYIDLVVYRDRDANTAWTSASDGTLEERIYYCQNWRADVSALVTDTGTMLEWVKYSAYGVPFGLPGGDTDSDGDCDSTDVTQVQTWIDAPAYDVRGDVDLDGDVDATDKSTIQSQYQGNASGRRLLSSPTTANTKGLAGYECVSPDAKWYLVRRRVLSTVIGRWLTRSPAGYKDGLSLYTYSKGMPVFSTGPTGAMVVGGSAGPGGSSGSSDRVYSGGPSVAGEMTDCEKLMAMATQQNPANAQKTGLAGCNGGVPFSCVYPENISANHEHAGEGEGGSTPPEMSAESGMAIEGCAAAHEAEHEGQADCAGTGPGVSAPNNDLTAPDLEAAALGTEIECFNSYLNSGNLPWDVEHVEEELDGACQEYSDVTGGQTHPGC